MTDTPSPYAAALLLERRWSPERRLTIDVELQREGWYVDDDGALAKIDEQPTGDVLERADLDPPPENTAEPVATRRAEIGRAHV